MTGKALFFAPHASIWVHAFPEAVVAEALRDAGYSVTVVGCGGLLSRRCTTFDAFGVAEPIADAVREAVCGNCLAKQALIDREFGFERLFIERFVTPEEIADIDACLASADIGALLETVVDDIPVGRFAAYEVLLNAKKHDFDFAPAERDAYRSYLRGCLLAIRAFTRIFEDERPSSLFTYNSLYCVNRTVSRMAAQRGINVYTLHAGGNLANRLQTLMVAQHDTVSHGRHLLGIWPAFAELPCPPDAAANVTDHLLEVMRGRSLFVYSAPAGAVDVRQRYGIGSDRKLLLATMSSSDERFAAAAIGLGVDESGVLFPTQIDWIRWLIEHVSDRPDRFLVVRVHPRDFPNKREARLSDHARMLRQALQHAPANVAVNFPEDGLSLYDFAPDVDVLLNGWSNAGKEFAMLGIPVVGYSAQVLAYPADLNLIGETHEAYAAAIDDGLSAGWSFERMRRTYRWLALEQVHSLLDIADSFSHSEVAERPSLPVRALRRVRSKLNPHWREGRDCRRRARPLGQGHRLATLLSRQAASIADVAQPPTVSVAEETRALTAELERLAAALNLDRKPESPLGRAAGIFLPRESLAHG